MTVIAALETERGAYIASDSFVVDELGAYYMHPTQTKVRKNGDWLIGTAGRMRVGQVVQYMELPAPPGPDDDPNAYMTRVIAKALQEEFEDAGLDFTDSGQKFISHSELLLVENGRVWTVSDDYAVCRATEYHESETLGYTAVATIGSGAAFALGAWYSLIDKDDSPEYIVETMVKAAIEFDFACGGEPQHWEQLIE